ncbi:archaemetzincin-2-like [Anneissia japonica]|uniref:archaemetzincin-2-like n=1 Tax=Anneissia japonica TaxID=1529436 RepID=UPI00142568C8|nr:archaemetzincin-2-like [Anneissia japonica]
MSLKTTSQSEDRKNARYLVGKLKNFDPNLQAYFMLSACCLERRSEPKDSIAVDRESIGLEEPCMKYDTKSVLFTPRSVPVVGRQTYPMWKGVVSGLGFNRKWKNPKTLLFLPIETLPDRVKEFRIGENSLLQWLCNFLKIFFSGMDVKFDNSYDLAQVKFTKRTHSVTGKEQILVSDLYSRLHSSFNIPMSTYILALTWTDLYPKKELNFVLGEASYSCRCAVFGFGRYEPMSYVSTPEGDDATKGITKENQLGMDSQLLWKLIRVASHETCHLLGLNHCLFFECSMNESKSVKEALSQPLFLCPVCLRKLHKSLGFDIRQRYSELKNFLQNTNNYFQNDKFEISIAWLDKCLEKLKIKS